MMLKIIFSLPILVLLSGCGGGSDSSSLPSSTVSPPLPTPNPQTCQQNHILLVDSATSDGTLVAGSTADMAIDGAMSSNSVWQSTDTNASLTIDLGALHQIGGVSLAWHQGDQNPIAFEIMLSEDGVAFQHGSGELQSSGKTRQLEQYALDDTPARFMRIRTNFTDAQNAGLTEVLVWGCALQGDARQAVSSFSVASLSLDPDLPPGSNFDLLSWKLDTPADLDEDGRADTASEADLDDGFNDVHFFTGEDGGMVFRSTISGAKTSANTSYTRSELREMLRRGNTDISTRGVNRNNWLLGYQPDVQIATGGRNGHLTASLAVNRVTETGEDYQVGRVIIGQIHAEDDEPVRLYYRKMPQNRNGYIYLAHELRGGDDTYRMVFGPTYSDHQRQPVITDDVSRGIALDEVFTYEIIQDGARIDVLIRKGGLTDAIVGHSYIDMDALNSGYDVPDEWMYFKAGAYSQNNTGNAEEYDQVTFYHLSTKHD